MAAGDLRFRSSCLIWSSNVSRSDLFASKLLIAKNKEVLNDFERSHWMQNFKPCSYVFFVVLSCHWPVLDGFDWHFQASVHFSQSSPINKFQGDGKIPEKLFGNIWIWTQGCGVRSKNATSVLCSPQYFKTWFKWFQTLLSSRHSFWRCRRHVQPQPPMPTSLQIRNDNLLN